MDERTDLEEYVDLARVPLDPIHDAVGKLVERCHGVESGLFLAASRRLSSISIRGWRSRSAV